MPFIADGMGRIGLGREHHCAEATCYIYEKASWRVLETAPQLDACRAACQERVALRAAIDVSGGSRTRVCLCY
ncbi:unnamed protein product [Toxocara canis]|uniref:Apple domain-containing protein n=1 Tax=Toxocara canis TaxID=6265 RepID=A0A183VCY2_TOXCA|nr:unnamed protein product [Toxocara canis]